MVTTVACGFLAFVAGFSAGWIWTQINGDLAAEVRSYSRGYRDGWSGIPSRAGDPESVDGLSDG